MTQTGPTSSPPPRGLGGLVAHWARVRAGVRAIASQDLPSAELAFPDGGDLAHERAFGHDYFLSRSPDHVEHVFVAGHDRYRKSVHYRLLAAVTGQGLLTNEGEPWAQQRRLMQPVFTKRHLDQLVPLMTAATEEFLDGWPPSSPGSVDVAAAMTELTLDVVGRALFGASLGDEVDRLRPAVAVGLNAALAAARLQLMFPVPRWFVDGVARAVARAPLLPPPLSRIHRVMRTIDSVVTEVIDRRISAGRDEDDLLGLLLAARDDEGRPMPRGQVRDEVVTLMLAGHETTANGLSWLWYLLARHPEARQRLHEEVDLVLAGRTPTAEDLDRLSWTTACFQEALRLFPPAWVLEREACADDELDGVPVRAGATIIFPVHLLHRDERWWPRPDRFDPERFLPGAAPPPRGAYLPFGAGRRMCIGANFALVEGTLIAAMIAQRHELDIGRDFAPVPSATVTLRPRGGLPMTPRRRRLGEPVG
jgi:cytochrome P450